VVLEGGEVVAHRTQLVGAGSGERQRVKQDQYRLIATEVGQRDDLVVLIPQREVGGSIAHSDRRAARGAHLLPARLLRPAIRAADQSPTVLIEVCDSPAIEAASAISDGSTKSSRPRFGVNS